MLALNFFQVPRSQQNVHIYGCRAWVFALRHPDFIDKIAKKINIEVYFINARLTTSSALVIAFQKIKIRTYNDIWSRNYVSLCIIAFAMRKLQVFGTYTIATRNGIVENLFSRTCIFQSQASRLSLVVPTIRLCFANDTISIPRVSSAPQMVPTAIVCCFLYNCSMRWKFPVTNIESNERRRFRAEITTSFPPYRFLMSINRFQFSNRG